MNVQQTINKREYDRIWTLANREQINLRAHKTRVIWRRANRDRVNAVQRRWIMANKEKIRESYRRWKDSGKRAIYLEKNRDSILEKGRIWRRNNRVIMVEATRKCRKANKGLEKMYKQRRRARKLSVAQCDQVSVTVLGQLISSAIRLKCGICGENMPKSDRTIDHIIPLSKHGTDSIENLRIVHLSCNCRKHDKLPHEFDGQSEINFAGNGAHPNNRNGEIGQVSKSLFKDQIQWKT